MASFPDLLQRNLDIQEILHVLTTSKIHGFFLFRFRCNTSRDATQDPTCFLRDSEETGDGNRTVTLVIETLANVLEKKFDEGR